MRGSGIDTVIVK